MTYSAYTQPPTRRRSCLPGLLLLGGFLLLLIWFSLKVYRIGRLALSLRDQAAIAQTMVEGGIGYVDPDGAEQLVYSIRRDVVALKGEAQPFLLLTPYLGWVPEIGPLLVNARPLLEMADAGSEAAAYLMRGLKPALALMQQGNTADLWPQLMQILANARPDLAQASLALDRLAAARADLKREEQLPDEARAALAQADEWLPLARQIIEMAPIVPNLLGSDGPRTYLIVAQNQDELRATGGFISGAGLLVVEGGRIVSLTFEDANLIDDWRNKPFAFPPQPLYTFMGLELFGFRDANFWPDFPTSALKVMELYTYNRGVSLDGVIALDQQFLELLIGAIGPLSVAELATTLDGSNVLDTLRGAWNPAEGQDAQTWLFSRKDFMVPIAAAILTRLQSEWEAIDPLQMGQTMLDALAARHLQIYVRDPSASVVLDNLDWDGRVENRPGEDTFMLVETNVGYNKVNPLISRTISYTVSLAADGTGTAEATIHYTHAGSHPEQPCQHIVPYSLEITYLQLIENCYWNYLRLVVPAGSDLQQASAHPAPGEVFVTGRPWDGQATVAADPTGLTVIENFLLLHQGESLTSGYIYRLPDVTSETADGRQQYRLTFYKQAGITSLPVTVVVNLPTGAKVVTAEPQPAAVVGQSVRFESVLTADAVFTVIFEP